MKLHLIGFTMLLAVGTTMAQERTLLGDDLTHGGYWAGGVALSQIGDETAYVSKSGAKWLINHRFTVATVNHSMFESLEFLNSAEGDERNIRMNYGGVQLGYIFAPDNLIHVSVNALAAMGGLSQQNRPLGTDPDLGDDIIYAFVPGVEVIVNLTHFLHIGVTADYRFVGGVDLAGIDNAALSNPTVGVVVQIGKF